MTKASSTLEFRPLENGLDYMTSVVDLLAGSPTERDLKYAVLHLSAGIEVLLKARLAQEHWTLVLDNVDEASKLKYERGDFISVGIKSAMRRLTETAEIEFSDAERSAVYTLIQKRNRLQHFGLEDSVQAVRAAAVRGLDFLITFAQQHLLPTDDDGSVADALEAVRGSMTSIKTFVRERRKSIRPRLDGLKIVVVCPYCGEWGLEPAETNRCHFCTDEVDSEVAAADYVENVLAITWRDVRKGADDPRHYCPECGEQTLVEGVDVLRDQQPAPASPCDYAPVHWVCFHEGIGYTAAEMDRCARCATPTTLGYGDGLPVCSDCTAYYLESD